MTATKQKTSQITCDRCGVNIKPDGIAQGHPMFIDSDGLRTCETLGGGENTPAHFNLFSLPSEGPYVGISRDRIVKKGKTRFRLLLYGAYNAFGLIGSEYNGICVLNEDGKNVVADNILQVDSGYFGPAKIQLDLFDKLVKAPAKVFREIVNASDNLRYSI